MSEGVLALPDQLEERRSRWVSVRAALLAGGRGALRATVVLAPVAVVLSGSGLSAQTLLEVAAASTIWFMALRSSYSGPGPSALVLGTSVVAAVGTITGLAALSVLDFWFHGLELSARQLLLMAGGVFLSSWAFEAKLQRRASRRRLLAVGADDGTRQLLDELGRQPRLPFDVIGIVDDDR